MTAAETILSVASWLGLALLAAAFLLTVWRVVKGPTLPDRVVALDMLVGIVIGFIALIAIRTGFTLYIDIAIALGLVGFLATVAFARFILAGAAPPAGGQVVADAADIDAVAGGTSSGKSAAGRKSKPAAKVPNKTASKTASRPPSKSTSKSAGKPADGPSGKSAGKRTAKPRKPAKGV